MGTVDNIKGRRFSRLKVIEFVGLNKFNKAQWRCKCDCGNEVVVLAACLKNKHTMSCGCLHAETVKVSRKKHGLRNHPLYHTWLNIKDRCGNPNNSHYHLYGGRGIKIVKEWRDNFKRFYDWAMSNGWKNHLSIERIDVNGNYSPRNCKWISFNEQPKNTRKSIFVFKDGKRFTAADVARETGIKPPTLYNCYHRHGSIIPTLHRRGFYEYKETM